MVACTIIKICISQKEKKDRLVVLGNWIYTLARKRIIIFIIHRRGNNQSGKKIMDAGKCGMASLVLLVLALGLAQGYEVISKDQDFILRLGDTVQLQCFISPENFNALDTPVMFFKDEVQISTNRYTQDPFSATGRYKVNMNDYPNNETTLVIDGVTVADNGKFVCKIGSDIAVSYTITTPESIEEVTMTSNSSEVNPETGGKVFKFEADKPSFVYCDVKGGRPEPKVQIFRDGTVDVTDSFTVVKADVVGESEGKGLEVRKYQVSLKNDDFMLSTDFNGQNLSCKANVPVNKAKTKELGITGLKLIDSAVMEITYAPKIVCDSEKETTEGTKQFRIECVVKANPKIDMQEIIWSFGEENTTKIKHVKDQTYVDGQYETMAKDDDAEVIVIFEIKNVNSSDFQVYTLQVENELGQETHDIHIFRKTTTHSTTTEMAKNEKGNPQPVEDGESGARNTVATILSLVLSVALALLL